ncbi:hypothetical protein D3C86_1035030 [compost metagenome]
MTLRILVHQIVDTLPHRDPDVDPAIVVSEEAGGVTLHELQRCEVLTHPDPWVTECRSRVQQWTELRACFTLVVTNRFTHHERSRTRVTNLRLQFSDVFDVNDLLSTLDQRVIDTDTEVYGVFGKVVDHRPLWER